MRLSVHQCDVCASNSSVSTLAELCPPFHKICFCFGVCYLSWHNCLVLVSHLNYPFTNMRQISLEVLHKEVSVCRPMQYGNRYAASSHNSFSWVSVPYVWILLSQTSDVLRYKKFKIHFQSCFFFAVGLCPFVVLLCTYTKRFIPGAACLLHSV